MDSFGIRNFFSLAILFRLRRAFVCFPDKKSFSTPPTDAQTLDGDKICINFSRSPPPKAGGERVRESE